MRLYVGQKFVVNGHEIEIKRIEIDGDKALEATWLLSECGNEIADITLYTNIGIMYPRDIYEQTKKP